MADNEQKALQLIAEAEKKLTSSKGFLGSLFGWVKIKIKISWKIFLNFVIFLHFFVVWFIFSEFYNLNVKIIKQWR